MTVIQTRAMVVATGALSRGGPGSVQAQPVGQPLVLCSSEDNNLILGGHLESSSYCIPCLGYLASLE